MHELSVCQGLLQQLAQITRQHQARGVSRITLQVGPLSGVEPRLLQDAFPIASAGSPAHQAELIIEALPIRVRCKHCGEETEATASRLLCGACGDWHTQLIRGDELLLARVELITDDDEGPA